MLQLLNQLSTQVDNALATVFANQYAATALTMFLVLYSGLAAPNLPPAVAALFDNPLFKLLILFLVLVVRNYDPTVALLTAIGFTISMQALNRYKMFGLTNGLGDMMRSQFGGEVEMENNSENEDKEEDAPVGMQSACLNGMGAPVEQESESDSEDEEEVNQEYDAYGFMGCRKPQPQGSDAVLPPQPEVPEQVAAVMNANCQYQGPQGMQYPTGYSGSEYGAAYATCGSEL